MPRLYQIKACYCKFKVSKDAPWDEGVLVTDSNGDNHFICKHGEYFKTVYNYQVLESRGCFMIMENGD